MVPHSGWQGCPYRTSWQGGGTFDQEPGLDHLEGTGRCLRLGTSAAVLWGQHWDLAVFPLAWLRAFMLAVRELELTDLAPACAACLLVH